jgi:hypothetical protein
MGMSASVVGAGAAGRRHHTGAGGYRMMWNWVASVASGTPLTERGVQDKVREVPRAVACWR